MLVGVAPRAVAELEPLVREALSTQSIHVCETAMDAMALVQSSRNTGLTPAVFIFDFRDKAPNDVANELRRIVRKHPEAELLVVAEAQGAAAFAACLQIISTPEKLTFLLAPLHRQLAVETIRTVARRHQVSSPPSRPPTAAGPMRTRWSYSSRNCGHASISPSMPRDTTT